MNVSSILSGNFLDSGTQNVASRMQQFRKDFQQLGQDLQSGNLSAASTDFAALQKDLSTSKSSASQNTNPVAQDLQQLSTDLQAGNLSGAQQDFTTLQQDMQSQATQSQRPHHHHRHQAEGNTEASTIAQALSQLGQDLQSGDMASAQKAYTSMQQDLQQYAIANGALNSVSTNSIKTTA